MSINADSSPEQTPRKATHVRKELYSRPLHMPHIFLATYEGLQLAGAAVVPGK